MMKFLKISILSMAFFSVAINVQAQKFGYLNSQAILAEMAEVQAMNSDLKALETQLTKKGQGMVAALQKKQADAQQKDAQKMLSPLDKEKILKELEDEQKKILEFEQKMQSQLAEKEQKLLTPILEKVNEAIKAVAKENGYNMIFEAGVLLFAEEGTDVSELVKAKL